MDCSLVPSRLCPCFLYIFGTTRPLVGWCINELFAWPGWQGHRSRREHLGRLGFGSRGGSADYPEHNGSRIEVWVVVGWRGVCASWPSSCFIFYLAVSFDLGSWCLSMYGALCLAGEGRAERANTQGRGNQPSCRSFRLRMKKKNIFFRVWCAFDATRALSWSGACAVVIVTSWW